MTHTSSIGYMAPQIMESKLYDLSLNIYILGRILYKMMTEKIPYQGKNEIELVA
jgi:serine/threonine protein kinase